MGKRIVSKGAYVKAQGQRAIVGVFAVGLAGFAALCGVVTLVGLPHRIARWWGKNSGVEAMLHLGYKLESR